MKCAVVLVTNYNMNGGKTMGHKKILTKAMSFLLSMVMILTMIPPMAMTAKATEGDTPSVKVYFKLPDGDAVTDWAVNAWETPGVTVTGDEEHAFRPVNWGTGAKYPTLLTEGAPEGWGYVTLTGTVTGMAFIKEDAEKKVTEIKCWNTQIAKLDLKEAYFIPDTDSKPVTGKWYKEASAENEIKEAEIKNIFVLAGDSRLNGTGWKIDVTGNEANILQQNTDDSNKYSVTYTNVAADEKGYEYKILQDPDNKKWDLPWGSAANRTLKVPAPADVTLTIDLTDTTKDVAVTYNYIKTLTVENENIVKGKETKLNTAAKYYDGISVTPEDVNVTYSLKTPTEGITLEDNKITVADTAEVTEVVVIATYGDINKAITIPVVSKEYTVNINMYSPDLEMKAGVSDIYIFEKGGSKELAIEPELQAVTISATMDTKLGKKTLPIVVTDQFGNEYTTTVDVTVSERKKAKDDFDWDEACIYFMVTDRFFDGNTNNNTASDQYLAADAAKNSTYGKGDPGPYHGGDFAGVTAKLDYLKNLGINTIWITPIVENIAGVNVTGTGSEDVPYNAAYHGYWASDFTKLNPTLGTEAEFKKMIDEAHSRGIKIMVDVVVNHAGYDTEFGDMIRSGEDVVSGDDQKDSLANLPDFKTEDASVRAQLVKWQTAWMKNYGIDYYRVDTVKHVEETTWAALKNSVSNTKYATVSSKGVVSTKSKGAGKYVTITATAADGSGVKATYKIKIVKDKVKSIKVSPSKKTVKAGTKVKLKATVKTTGKTANTKLTWSSSNKKYATVSSKGVVTTKKAGKGKTVKITAKATDGSGKKKTVKIKK